MTNKKTKKTNFEKSSRVTIYLNEQNARKLQLLPSIFNLKASEVHNLIVEECWEAHKLNEKSIENIL